MTGFGKRSYGLSVRQCKDSFVSFLNSPIAKGIQAEELERLLAPMAECFDCSEEAVLKSLTSRQARMLKRVNALYNLAINAMEGLRWMQRN